MLVRQIEQFRIGLTDDNFSMLHLNAMKTRSKTEKEISHMEFLLNGSVFMLRP